MSMVRALTGCVCVVARVAPCPPPPKESGCSALLKISRGSKVAPCGWDDSPMHPRAWGGLGPLLRHLRLRFMARAARLGYNILALDRWGGMPAAWLCTNHRGILDQGLVWLQRL